MNNSRNNAGFKDSTNCYLKGGEWEQWTDFNFEGSTELYDIKEARKDMKKHEELYQDKEFKIKRIYPEKFIRTYSRQN